MIDTIQAENVSVASRVSLRAGFPAELVHKLWRWLNSPRACNFDDFGPQGVNEFAFDLGRRLATEKTWAICLDGEVVGYLGFLQQSPMAGQFHGMVIDPKFRGLGIGTEAMHAATIELATHGFKSLAVMPFAWNLAIIPVLLSAGFAKVGTLTGATRHQGESSDISIWQWRCE